MRPIALLHLEDDPLDGELVAERLQRDGVPCVATRVDSREGFVQALERGDVDIILADFNLPRYDGMSALQVARTLRPDAPFIFVSGAIGEERAIETLRRGATDYVLKHRLDRLAPAVVRALQEAEDRVARRRAEAERDRLLEREREARREAEVASRMKDEFLAMLSHELRNPLGAIASAAQLIQRRGHEPESVHHAQEILARHIANMTRLLDDLLDVSRITRGKIELRKHPVDLAAVARQAVEAVRPQIDAREQSLVVDLPDAPIVAMGDTTRLEQVVANLLHNAAKYTDPGGTIRLAIAREDGDVVARVIDSGIGIPAESLPRIFEPFAQLERSLDRSQGGLGIGLTLVKRLVEMHGGSVVAESAGIGKGSVFVVRLPALLGKGEGKGEEAPAGAPVARPARTEPPPTVPGLRVLVVDDNEDIADVLADMLTSSGLDVEVARDGPSALEAAARWRPEVVLLDLGLPGLDGFEVARRLRVDHPPETLRLVALSGYGRDTDRRRSREAGFDHHLVKPVDFDVLLDILQGTPRR